MTAPSPGAAHRPPLRDATIAMLLVVLLDQVTKYIVVDRMDLRSVGEIGVFPSLIFRMAWNRGVNFGLLDGDSGMMRWILVIVAVVVTVGLLHSSRRSQHMATAAGLGIVAGGAIGNAIDRVRWGAVADFLNVSCCGIHNPWSFNVADIAIFLGVGVVLWSTRAPTSNVRPDDQQAGYHRLS